MAKNSSKKVVAVDVSSDPAVIAARDYYKVVAQAWAADKASDKAVQAAIAALDAAKAAAVAKASSNA